MWFSETTKRTHSTMLEIIFVRLRMLLILVLTFYFSGPIHASLII